MKKINFIAFLMILFTFFSISCTNVDIANQTIPSFEELLEINTYDNMLKNHVNFYVENLWHDKEDNSYNVEEMLFMRGEGGKVNYHIRRKNITTNKESFGVSRIGNEWYYNSSDAQPMAVFELGELSILDNYISVLPQFILGDVIGKGYFENDQIVYHASHITEATEYYPAKRSDFIYYFNKETYFIEKVDELEYNSEHKLAYTYCVEFNYDVDGEKIFPTTIYDSVYSSEKRIELEIIHNFNTEEQKAYSFFATTDMQVVMTVDFAVYELYSDCEFTNLVSSLNAYDGQKKLTLYAKYSHEFL